MTLGETVVNFTTLETLSKNDSCLIFLEGLQKPVFEMVGPGFSFAR
jgi:hypothetical protein